MNISVEYKDTSGTISNQNYNLTQIAFAKHFAIAGQGYAPRARKLVRTISMFFHYNQYLQRHAFNNDRFSEPPAKLSDPTEKGQFSNLAGRAIADFLSKRIDHSIFTVNYEAAMRIHNPPIPLTVNGKSVKRPDLLAYSRNSRFAIEAKGFSGGCGNMNSHKSQSQTGGILVNYTVASVAYNLYGQVKCKYHDPYNENIPFDNELLKKLTKSYYSGLLEFLDEKFFDYNEMEMQDEKFYEIEISYKQFQKFFPNEFPFSYFRYWDIRHLPTLILPRNIRELAETGISNENKPFMFETLENNNIYIDNDRVGLKIR
ncbi:hypothetical protein [Chryseobacterium nepalense]|uniref:hypothetical protein n=1 Tax=Chryseobacterium nepalense TaxID=1854498 RepID=UPI002E0108FB|nr:hypothetical protein [Chryseobacterium nepalense]